MNNTYKNKTFSVSLFAVVFILIIITISSLKIYSLCFSKTPNETDTNRALNSISSNTNEILKEAIEIQEEIQQIYTYTSDNGETYDMIGTLKIPSLNIEYPILANTSEKLLKISLTKYWGGNPNEVGNLCILGHNYKNSKFFGKLPNIEKNAIVQITDVSGRTLEYKVYETSIVEPDDTSCTSQLTDGHTEITLITCYYENGNTHATKRFVAKARAY